MPQPLETTDLITTAAAFVNSTSAHIFLTGKAGTGKTTFLRDLAEKTHKRYAIVAPTGIAALNAKGVTIHSQFLLPLGTFVPIRDPSGSISESANIYTQSTLARKHPLNSARKQVLRDIDLLIIDEVSMLRADILDAIDYRLKSARGNFQMSFGGVQLLLIGDLYQLPPVVREHEWQLLREHYANAFFFESIALKTAGYVYIELDKIFRQTNHRFIEILNNLRNNVPTREDIDTLNSHYKPESERKNISNTITLCTHNAQANKMNRKALDELTNDSRYYQAEIEGDFPESMYPVDESLELKEGAQIMFIKNDSTEGMYYNGKLAKVISLSSAEITVEIAEDRLHYTLKKERWENRKYTVDKDTKELEEDIVGSFTQYPIKLAWAITVHKSQGLTFDKAIIDVGRAFAPGQVYVALSRLRSLDGLILGTKIDTSVISSDANVVSFSKRKDEQEPLPQLLNVGQRHYLNQLVSDTFDFGVILKQISKTIGGQSANMEFEDESMRTALNSIETKLKAETENTAKFRSQLMRLLASDDRSTLKERIDRGSTYYTKLLKDCLLDLLRHMADVSQLSRVKTYANALDEIDQLITKKLIDLGSVEHITAQVLAGAEIGPRKVRAAAIYQARQQMLDQVETELKAKPGYQSKRKSGKKKKSGKAPAKGETYLKSLALFREKKTIAQVAEERGLSVGTIEGHAERLIGNGDLEASQFIDPEDIKKLAAALLDNQGKGVGSVVAQFDGKFSFGQVRMVAAALPKRE